MTRNAPPASPPKPAANRWLTAAMVGMLLVGALVVGIPLAASGATTAETVTIDADHELATADSIERWERDQTNAVTASNVGGLDLTVTLSKDAAGAGLDDRWRASSLNTYVRFTYREEIARTVRIYLPAEYVTPRSRGDLQAENADVTADLAPVADREYVAVTVRFDGRTDATFAMSELRGSYFGFREDVDRLINRTTGFDLPDFSFGSDAEWQYVPDHSLSGQNTTYAISLNDSHDPDDLTIQYARPTNDDDEHWLAVPDCDETAAVCRFQKDGNGTAVHLLSTAQDPPTVRYRYGTDASTSAESVWDDLASMPSRIADAASDLWPFSGDGGE